LVSPDRRSFCKAVPHLPAVRSKHNLRFYAIKVLNKAKVDKTKQVEHTNNEQRLLEAVQHPFIINLWGTFQDSSNLYMVMDFVPGGELFTLLRRSNVSNSAIKSTNLF
jgi:protein kinase A